MTAGSTEENAYSCSGDCGDALSTLCSDIITVRQEMKLVLPTLFDRLHVDEYYERSRMVEWYGMEYGGRINVPVGVVHAQHLFAAVKNSVPFMIGAIRERDCTIKALENVCHLGLT